MNGLLFRIVLPALFVPAMVFAQSQTPVSGGRYHAPNDFRGAVDQDGARAAVRRGDAAPFLDILRKVRPHLTGEIVGQKLEQHQGVWLYEFRIVTLGGHMRYLHFAARTGEPYTVKPLP